MMRGFMAKEVGEMQSQQDAVSIVRSILDANLYMILGTADQDGQDGQPWVSPVYYACAEYRTLYWISSPQATHSRNLEARPQISIVVFDSQAPVGAAQAVYMTAVADEVPEMELDQGLAIYNGRLPDTAARGARMIGREVVQPPGPYRLYRAQVSEHWVLDLASSPDHRISVAL
jgi:hypothetical protein